MAKLCKPFLNRRRFLKSAAGFSASVPLMSGLMAQNAFAADTAGYKALVCLTFKGGIDGSDLLMPIDAAAHADFRGVRADLLDSYADNSRQRENLLSVGLAEDGLEYGLPGELAPMQALFNDNKAAIVANVGTLVEPTNRTLFHSTSTLPRKLFSHNDQQSIWLTGDVEGLAPGYGGRFMDAVYASDPGHNRIYGALGLTSSRHGYLTGQTARGLVIPTGEPDRLRLVSNRSKMSWIAAQDDAYNALMAEHLRQGGLAPASPYARDLTDMARRGMDNIDFYNQTMEGAPDVTSAVTTIAQQFAKIAQTAAMASSFGVTRQVFYVQAPGGFDTHAAQAGQQSRLRDTAAAIAEFMSSLSALGLQDNVTLFTASDFGRTLSTNGNGSDHGWGSHHFVVGGAVKGGQIIGSPPPYDNLSEQYTDSRMRLIPDISVDQYVNTLGRWFGLNTTDLGTILPNLSNFDAPVLDLFNVAV